jgi:hypothetical protein
MLAQIIPLQRTIRDTQFLDSYFMVKLLMRTNLWTATLYAFVNFILDPVDFGSTISGFAAAMTSSVRWRSINSPREAKNVPPFTHPPTRGRLIVKHAAICAMSLVVLDLMANSSNPEDLIGEATLKRQQVFRFTQMNLEEAALRAGTTAGLWFGTYVLVNALYSGLAVTFLALGTEPSIWRPIFGYARDMYSVRNFWGYVWPPTFLPLVG